VGRLLLLMVLAPCLSGCGLALLAGEVAARRDKDQRDKKAFTENFQRENLELQKAGLPPVDWCAEIYREKPHWYHWDGSCGNPPTVPQQPKT
jgi:hypothetical protein